MLDLRQINLGQHNIASFQKKRDAMAAAKATNKWQSSDVFRAYNRFCIFWLVGQVFGDMRVLAKDGGTVTIPFPPSSHPDLEK